MKLKEALTYSGGDVTKMPVIGYIVTKPINSVGREHSFNFPSEKLDVVEIIDDGNIYVINRWYKGRIPQIVHKNLVKKFVSLK